MLGFSRKGWKTSLGVVTKTSWEADVLPLNYARAGGRIAKACIMPQGRLALKDRTNAGG